ncbi:hypothetical protein MBM_06443 [Drepanopeziza brunnea f. sp. 'multigermtubi' MB_m1]|uniref:Uncharacterized protein n=1 Tax=Marssonina brunnea f. sp. multigermtubi (strain MB_m1) TaxID=1072389 RepID=K1WS85_MARBU|nr:uncharacterized protein MBM_06443 [Drepanopeziza brunnea f. sp. 'multigermtubi' MB_m1]EKD15227.1 hypothetical protein MBM_06443 [Drepanopeziza brunnea f. sp. 'multigermtubi' MB_m1]
MVNNHFPVQATELQNFCVGMPGGQRTFDLVPTTLVKSNGNQKPMTSKAAKKAYQQANRGPKITRAEQRKRDAAELEAQRKEYEKEKAAVRAKAAREKKAAKANAEKEARRKKGLPEPSKFVRASQPTISRFIRSDSNGKRKWEKVGDVVEVSDSNTTSGTERGDEGPPAKRMASIGEDSEDEFGEFPSLSQTDILEKIDGSIKPNKYGASDAELSFLESCPPLEPHYREASQELPSRKLSAEAPGEDFEAFDEMATTQLLSDLAEAIAKSDSIELPVESPPPEYTNKRLKSVVMAAASPKSSVRVVGKSGIATEVHSKGVSQTNTSTVRLDVESTASRSPKSNQLNLYPKAVQSLQCANGQHDAMNTTVQAVKPFLQERSTNMPPPRLPIKKTGSVAFANTPNRTANSQKTKKMGCRTIPNVPPTPTQAFLEDHMDDFFPSPTQEIRELLEDVDDLPSNAEISKEPISEKQADTSDFYDLICTQAFALSPEDLAEIATPSRAPLKPLAVPVSVASHPVSREKRRFFEEKDEDVLHAAIHESRSLAINEIKKAPSNDVASFNKYQPDSADYGDLDLEFVDPTHPFQNDEEKQLEAAIRESKILAEQESERAASFKQPPHNSAQSDSSDYGDFEHFFEEQAEEVSRGFQEDRRPALADTSQQYQPPEKEVKSAPAGGRKAERRFFQEKDEDVLHAAIYESTRETVWKVPVKQPPRLPQRTLKRVQSTASDYGDDDFSGCSQELLDLCGRG